VTEAAQEDTCIQDWFELDEGDLGFQLFFLFIVFK
jgi:hypothetical protein